MQAAVSSTYTAGHGRQQSRAIPAAARSTQPATANLATAKAVHGGGVMKQRAIDDRVASMWRRVQETERRPKQMLG